MRAKSSKQRCPALCLIDLSYNVKYQWSCRVGGCSGHLTASGSWHGFPEVDHEGRQDVAKRKLLSLLILFTAQWCIQNFQTGEKIFLKRNTFAAKFLAFFTENRGFHAIFRQKLANFVLVC